jgi:hypothetical protein
MSTFSTPYMSSPSSYVSNAGKYLLDSVDALVGTDLAKQGLKLTTVSASRRATGEIVAQSSSSNNVGVDISGIAKKLITLGIASAAVFGSAFYIGYQLARRRHRFHVREADKNDQVKTWRRIKN